MWKKIHKCPVFYINFTQEILYEIFITDFINIWSTTFTKKEFLECLKKNNDRLEYDNDNTFIENGINILSNPEKLLKISLERNENDNSLELLLFQVIDCPFKLKCQLLKGSEQLFFNKITSPLLKIIQDLLLSESELSEEIKRKDDEIFVYKSKGKETSLRSIRTKQFIEDIHKRNHKVFDMFFGQSGVPQITMPDLVENEINEKKDTEISQEMKVDTKENVKVEPETIANVSSGVNTYDNMNSMGVSNIKQEVLENTQSMSETKVKRRKKGINL